MRTTCRDVCENASELLEKKAAGTLPADLAADWAELELHLSLCPPCIEYVRQIGLTVDALRCLPGTAGDQARSELMARFDAWAASRRGSPG